MKILKRIAALVLVMAMCLSFTGCYNEDLTWAAKNGNEEIPVGIYLYYLTLAIDEAAKNVDSNTEVLSAEIDGKSAEEWIRDRAYVYLQRYIWMDDVTDKLNLNLTQNEKESAEYTATYLIQNYYTGFEDIGVSSDSFCKAYSEYNMLFKKLFDYYYNEGGEFEIPKDDLHDSYVDGKYCFEYVIASLTTTTDEYGKSRDMTEEEIETRRKSFDAFKKKVDTGYQDIEMCAEEMKIETQSQTAPYTYVAATDFNSGDTFPTELVSGIPEMKEGETIIVEAAGQICLARKLSIEDSFVKAYDSSSDRLTMMLDLKSDEFNEYIENKAAEEGADIEMNDAVIKNYKLKDLITDKNRMGTKIAVSEN
ncbi:MAG: hypothetical protein Q4C42_00130 [Clostridia bacterium]|nr:hypothetical protein [Clostridia bacterium]